MLLPRPGGPAYRRMLLLLLLALPALSSHESRKLAELALEEKKVEWGSRCDNANSDSTNRMTLA